MSLIPPYLVMDDFLPENLHAGLLAHALSGEEHYIPTSVVRQGEASLTPDERVSWIMPDGIGPCRAEFIAFLSARQAEITERLRIPAFVPEVIESEIVAHRHGDFYRKHVDTFLKADRNGRQFNRILTMVYYFHAQPRRFSGGELALFPFGTGEPVLIEPRDNRLLAFPAFAPHEVRPVHAPGEGLSAARFAVNVWFNRAQTAD